MSISIHPNKIAPGLLLLALAGAGCNSPAAPPVESPPVAAAPTTPATPTKPKRVKPISIKRQFIHDEILRLANVPDDVEFTEWAGPETAHWTPQDEPSTCAVYVAYRSRNTLGAMVFRQEIYFLKDSDIVYREDARSRDDLEYLIEVGKERHRINIDYSKRYGAIP